MDAVLASVITSGVAVISTSTVAIWNARQSVKVTRETRTHQRLAESYLEVLRIVQREGEWVEAGIRITNWVIAAEKDGFMVDPEDRGSVPEFKHVRIPELTAADKATIAAHLAAFGSDNVRGLYQIWRSTIAAIGTEIVVVKPGTDGYPEGPDHDQVRHLREELYPREVGARQALAVAIAEELGHR